MLQVGKIIKFNKERGFGFIESEDTKVEVFFHITDFPKGKLPQIGERLTFNIRQHENKLKAVNIIRLDFPKKQPHTKKTISEDQEKFSLLGWLINLAVVGLIGSVIGYFIYNYIIDAHNRYELAQQPAVSQPLLNNTSSFTERSQSSITNNSYECDGRIHCSQMRSKEEAIWFINHCPGTKMDGDGDGDPCERDF